MPDITYEIKFKTARSGGSGGQNVNKVETMVEGSWHVASSSLFNEEEKIRIADKLSNRITAAGYLMVKSQRERTQLGNREDVIEKMNALVAEALVIPKKRKPTRVSRAAKEKRLTGKKIASEKKSERKKVLL